MLQEVVIVEELAQQIDSTEPAPAIGLSDEALQQVSGGSPGAINID